MRITKDQTTSAAALIDAVFITADQDARPPASAPAVAETAETTSSSGIAAAATSATEPSSSCRLAGQWGGKGKADGQFEKPIDVAVDPQGCVYVSDTGNRRIQKFDGSGKFLCQFGHKGSQEERLGRPGGIAVDPAGNIYVVDRQSHRVKKYAPQNGSRP